MELPINQIVCGDNLETMRTWPSNSVHCCVTSPPYWGLRDYGHDGQIGLEDTPKAYVARMVEVFREVRRVLRDDGTLWLNLGDSYAGSTSGNTRSNLGKLSEKLDGCPRDPLSPSRVEYKVANRPDACDSGLKPKDLVGIPWRVAFALQADGWWLRQDIIWHKPNPMPESVTDRCTKAHEYVFLLTKSERYYYDADAVREKAQTKPHGPGYVSFDPNSMRNDKTQGNEANERVWGADGNRNRRSVWTVTTKPYSGAHFAVMPPDLVEPCIKAGCPEGGIVLDPFMGSGTVAMVARNLSCRYIGCELNPEYVAISSRRLEQGVLF